MQEHPWLKDLLELLDQALLEYNRGVALLKQEALPEDQRLQQLAQQLRYRQALEDFSLEPLRLIAAEGQPPPSLVEQVIQAAKEKGRLLEVGLAERIGSLVPWLGLKGGQAEPGREERWVQLAKQALAAKEQDRQSQWSDLSSQAEVDQGEMKQLEQEFEAEAVDHQIIDDINEQLTELEQQFHQDTGQARRQDQHKLVLAPRQAKVSDKFMLALQFLPDQVLVGGGDDHVRFIDRKSFTQGKLLPFQQTVTNLAVNHSREIVAVSTCDELFFYNIAIQKLVRAEPPTSTGGPVFQPLFLQWHSKGNALLVGGKQPQFYILNESGRPYMTFFGHQGQITAGGYTPDCKKVVSTSTDASLRLWDPKTGQCLKKVSGHGFHELQIVSLSLHSNNKLAATGSTDGSICLSNYQTGKPLLKDQSAENSVQLVRFYEKTQQLIAGSVSGQLLLFDVVKGKLTRSLTFPSAITDLATAQSLNVVAIAEFSGRISVFDLRQQVTPGSKGLSVGCGSTVHRVRCGGDGVWAVCESGAVSFMEWRGGRA